MTRLFIETWEGMDQGDRRFPLPRPIEDGNRSIFHEFPDRIESDTSPHEPRFVDNLENLFQHLL